MTLLKVQDEDGSIQQFEASPLESAACFAQFSEENGETFAVVVISLRVDGRWSHFYLDPDGAVELGQALSLSGQEGSLAECGGVEH